MKSPFTIIRGGQSTSTPPPTEFARFDHKRAKMDRIKSQFIALRDKAIMQERSKTK